jgi:exopolyphosphatase / guanosine-5'-triphosphate,3'-diphosphate pyrophosphatase
MGEIAAVVDIGTQSTRLLISDGRRDLVRTAVITHLGRGIKERGSFDPGCLDATLAVLADFRRLADEHGATRRRAISTESVRLARDPDSFLVPAAETLGVRPELVSGEEEGGLAFAGATAKLDPATGPFVTVDLGGGSTEFAVGTERCDGVVSAPFGATVLTETYVAGDPPAPEELSAMLTIVEAHLDDVVRELPAVADANRFLGLGGTFTTMAAVEIGLDPYDRERVNGFTLERAAAEDVFRTLVTEDHAARVHNPGLPEARARTIVGGASAVVGLMRFFGLAELTISDDDLLDGLVARLLDG